MLYIKGDFMINNKEELIRKLQKNNKIYINHSLLSINYLNIYDNDIRMIYTDDVWNDPHEGKKQIQFCDSYGMMIFMIYLEDLIEFEQIMEYEK